jgi:hypothetical protein
MFVWVLLLAQSRLRALLPLQHVMNSPTRVASCHVETKRRRDVRNKYTLGEASQVKWAHAIYQSVTAGGVANFTSFIFPLQLQAHVLL